ncbi:MAG TPA: helix-turn-helix transcriptional regulator [Abditibacteriaceae bacterium]
MPKEMLPIQFDNYQSEILGKIVRDRRKSGRNRCHRRLTQGDLASAVGVSLPTISQVEMGVKRYVKPSFLKQLLHELDMDMEELESELNAAFQRLDMQVAKSTRATASVHNTSGNSNLSDRLSWAIRCIASDPDWPDVTNVMNESAVGPRAAFIAAYERATGRMLLTPKEAASVAPLWRGTQSSDALTTAKASKEIDEPVKITRIVKPKKERTAKAVRITYTEVKKGV